MNPVCELFSVDAGPYAVVKRFGMADSGCSRDAAIHPVWRGLTKQAEAQGEALDAWLHSTGSLGAGVAKQIRTGTGRHTMVDSTAEALEPAHRFGHPHFDAVP